MTAAAESFQKPPSRLLQSVPTQEASPMSPEPFKKEPIAERKTGSQETGSAQEVKQQILQRHIDELEKTDIKDKKEQIARLRALIAGEPQRVPGRKPAPESGVVRQTPEETPVDETQRAIRAAEKTAFGQKLTEALGGNLTETDIESGLGTLHPIPEPAPPTPVRTRTRRALSSIAPPPPAAE